MYTLFLILHSWLRWIAIAAGVGATAAATGSPTGGAGQRAGLFFMIAMDLQMLIGLLLYLFISPTTTAIFQNFGAAMRDPVARFWAVEHVTMMVAAVVLAHLGRVLARRAKTPASARMRQLICFGLATLLMIAGTPWPGTRAGRPLFRV
jgi:hypothetical protein